jgi:hypothetical protein
VDACRARHFGMRRTAQWVRWRIFEIGGLDAAAEDALRRLAKYLEKLDESIARFEERLALSPIPRIASAK